jgi:hypothetical protein
MKFTEAEGNGTFFVRGRIHCWNQGGVSGSLVEAPDGRSAQEKVGCTKDQTGQSISNHPWQEPSST